jgi:hypothetical protein
MTQFVQVEFRLGGKLYCYHNLKQRLEPGDTVSIDTPDGWQRITVVWVDVPKPTAFETKELDWQDLKRGSAVPG